MYSLYLSFLIFFNGNPPHFICQPFTQLYFSSFPSLEHWFGLYFFSSTHAYKLLVLPCAQLPTAWKTPVACRPVLGQSASLALPCQGYRNGHRQSIGSEPSLSSLFHSSTWACHSRLGDLGRLGMVYSWSATAPLGAWSATAPLGAWSVYLPVSLEDGLRQLLKEHGLDQEQTMQTVFLSLGSNAVRHPQRGHWSTFLWSVTNSFIILTR